MDKFGLFDILSKLQGNDKQNNAILNLLNNLANSNLLKANEISKEKGESPKPTEPPPYFRNQAIIKVIKNHDLISKQIDKDNKKR